jgi:hypothetical protein
MFSFIVATKTFLLLTVKLQDSPPGMMHGRDEAAPTPSFVEPHVKHIAGVDGEGLVHAPSLCPPCISAGDAARLWYTEFATLSTSCCIM